MAETYPELTTKLEQEAENNNFINSVSAITDKTEDKKPTTKK